MLNKGRRRDHHGTDLRTGGFNLGALGERKGTVFDTIVGETNVDWRTPTLS